MPSNYNAQIILGNKSAATATFVEDEILMPKSSQRNAVPAIIGIEIEHMAAVELEDKKSEWALCSKSNDAMPDLDDSEVVTKGIRGFKFTTSGQLIEDRIERVHFDAPIPIVSDKLYFQFLQDSGSTHVYRYRIIWVPRYVAGARQQQQMRGAPQW